MITYIFTYASCCWVDFEDTSAVDDAVALNGEVVLGRAMRVDYDAASAVAGRRSTSMSSAYAESK